jgi:hypothetical protein
LTLDRAGIRLFLPAAVLSAVVLQDELPGLQNPSVAVRRRLDVMMSATRASDRGGVHVQRI